MAAEPPDIDPDGGDAFWHQLRRDIDRELGFPQTLPAEAPARGRWRRTTLRAAGVVGLLGLLSVGSLFVSRFSGRNSSFELDTLQKASAAVMSPNEGTDPDDSLVRASSAIGAVYMRVFQEIGRLRAADLDATTRTELERVGATIREAVTTPVGPPPRLPTDLRPLVDLIVNPNTDPGQRRAALEQVAQEVVLAVSVLQHAQQRYSGSQPSTDATRFLDRLRKRVFPDPQAPSKGSGEPPRKDGDDRPPL